MRDAILKEIDKLRMMVMFDMVSPSKSDLERYEEWIDEMNGRHYSLGKDFYGWPVYNNRRYSEYKVTRSMVDDLYYKKFSDKKEYHKHRPKIVKIIAEVVAMTLFIKEAK